ncbi:hypothetical protein [Anabaena sp. UHCC 0399]|uniref:hypothetical protein n=1 Tax=Anabaena sp. UHCC 0399 TaxID=3110238 RepID=UPI002B2058B0|nr:hypothetical protein [Anabaena sp. UHCC 0399]MEA5566308.1 hypothetical protein [Anabaena sp. UHCC 0399]
MVRLLREQNQALTLLSAVSDRGALSSVLSQKKNTQDFRTRYKPRKKVWDFLTQHSSLFEIEKIKLDKN